MKTQVGDIVEFTLDGRTETDVVKHVQGEVIEGQVYDLTYVDFKVIGHDLFECPEAMPDFVSEVLERFSEEDIESYEGCARLQRELEKVGYTIDWYLDATPYNLRKMDVNLIANDDRIAPDVITNLYAREVFVFGSNLQGQHMGGAAKIAYERFEAKWGMEEGMSGDTYAIPTVDLTSKSSMPIEDIKMFVDRFILFAASNPDKTFLVTAIGCGIAGYTPEQIAPMFRDCITIVNVKLPLSFWEVILNSNKN
jgi:hypothetical protein